jgi:hypothetical protein
MWRKLRREKYRCRPVRPANDSDGSCFIEREAE